MKLRTRKARVMAIFPAESSGLSWCTRTALTSLSVAIAVTIIRASLLTIKPIVTGIAALGAMAHIITLIVSASAWAIVAKANAILCTNLGKVSRIALTGQPTVTITPMLHQSEVWTSLGAIITIERNLHLIRF